MAGAKQSKQSKKTDARSSLSWKQFFIALSLSVNIAFVVVVITMMTSNALDGMFMNVGLSRYCSSSNDDKFVDAGERSQALRAYTCAIGDAKQYFDTGFQSYLDYKNIK